MTETWQIMRFHHSRQSYSRYQNSILCMKRIPTALLSYLYCLPTRNLNGNQINKLTITTTQANFLKRLDDDTKLGILSMSGSCGSKATELKIHDSIVCIDDSSGTSRLYLSIYSCSFSIIRIEQDYYHCRMCLFGPYLTAGARCILLVSPQKTQFGIS